MLREMKIAALATTMLVAGAATAAPVAFTITGGGYQVGSGYGCNSNAQSLCIITNDAPIDAVDKNFTLSEGEFEDIDFGRVSIFDNGTDFQNLNNGETDNLEITAFVRFTSPITGRVETVSSVAAFVGAFDDNAIDIRYEFAPTDVDFGNGGRFRVNFSDLNFRDAPELLAQTVRVRLLDEPIAEPVDVPEPGTLALLGLGLLGLGAARRRVRA